MKKLVGAILILVLVFSAMIVYAAEPIELRIAWWGGQARADKTIKVIEMFMQEHPDIKIIYR
jgi:ABC-type glycerol-3-phosphate transport system substrate-binding protein